MKIGIDISQIVYGTGVSLYTKQLVENLLKIDTQNQYVLFGGSLRRKQDILNLFPQSKVFPIPPTLADLVWNRLHVMPVEKLIGEIDVLHTSDWTEPPSKAFKVATVHDLYSLKFPRMIDPLIREVHKRKLAWVFKESSRVIVPSKATKDDLIGFGMDENKIRVIQEAPNLEKATSAEVEKTKQKYGITGDYVIAIGITKLKNTENIIKAFDLARHGQDIKLLLVGRPVGVKLEVVRNVRNLGYIESDELSPLLTGSRGLIFPSIYEGFGVPILEAFNCGVPVVTSNIGSMLEVAGDAAVLVDPYNVNSIAEGIIKALKGPKGLIEKGTSRVKQFSWEDTARKTLEVYMEAK
ncbi:MAG TPA: glycosyltransferase family 1 protein [Patescibacteria group bacterium]|nr:glycosyltransferase family 1 protein [Patescibacteria group bacterium]